MTVTAIVPVDKRKCKVFLGEDFAFVLYKSEAARFHIEEENELSEQTYEKIKEEILLKRARDRALYLLQSQGRTKAEMIQKLQKDGYPDDVIREVMSFLEEYHFVDDSSYTENYIHVNKSRKSPRQIVFELQQKGVDKDTISRMLEEAPINEDDTVRALLKKKTRRTDPSGLERKAETGCFFRQKRLFF